MGSGGIFRGEMMLVWMRGSRGERSGFWEVSLIGDELDEGRLGK